MVMSRAWFNVRSSKLNQKWKDFDCVCFEIATGHQICQLDGAWPSQSEMESSL